MKPRLTQQLSGRVGTKDYLLDSLSVVGVGPRPAASAPPAHLEVSSKCKFSGPSLLVLNQKLWGWGLVICIFVSAPRDANARSSSEPQS